MIAVWSGYRSAEISRLVNRLVCGRVMVLGKSLGQTLWCRVNIGVSPVINHTDGSRAAMKRQKAPRPGPGANNHSTGATLSGLSQGDGILTAGHPLLSP